MLWYSRPVLRSYCSLFRLSYFVACIEDIIKVFLLSSGSCVNIFRYLIKILNVKAVIITDQQIKDASLLLKTVRISIHI